MRNSQADPKTNNPRGMAGATAGQCILSVAGMQCAGCETIIEDTLAALPGIRQAKADYATGRLAASYDPGQTTVNHITRALAAKGYQASLPDAPKAAWLSRLGYLLLPFAAVGLLLSVKAAWRALDLPQLDARASDGMALLVGLVSSLHCIGMCGSFVIGYSSEDARWGRSPWRSHLAYGAGKTLSYAAFGGLFGYAGSLLAVTPQMAGISAVLAGAFLVVYGMNMLGFWLRLRWLRLRQPEVLARYAIRQKRQAKSPWVVGLCTGLLLACGPLQAMYVMAAGLGDPWQGAKLLALFGLGTLPALLGLGLLACRLPGGAIQGVMKVAGYVLIIMGLMLANNGVKKALPGYDVQALLYKAAPEGLRPYLTDDAVAMESCH